MSFGWLGTFRQGQWQAYRSFVLNERKDVGRRMAVIQAELGRIGSVTVLYGRTTDEATGAETVTERRVGFKVSQGTSLEKLIRAYVAQGGNPFDISLFLTPDATVLTEAAEDASEVQTQPYGGVVFPKSGKYAPGVIYDGGFLVVKKYTPARTQGKMELQDDVLASAVDRSRRWVNQVVQERIHDLEARIIKLCDLREQLLIELDTLTMAVGGTLGDVPTLDEDFYAKRIGVPGLVSTIDAMFYTIGEDGTPDFASVNEEALAKHPSLLLDVEEDEANTAL